MPSKLSIYNDALTNLLGSRKLDTLEDDVPSRHWLDSSWDADLVQSIFEDTDWNFAMKSVRSTYDTSIEPLFGHNRGHAEPSDIWRLSGVYSDPDMQEPMKDWEYIWERGVFYTSNQTIYLKYQPSTLLDDISGWPAGFARHVAGQLALNAAGRFKKTTDHQTIAALAMDRERKAKSDDAQRNPPKRPPPGNWIRARRGSRRYNGRSA